MPSKRTSRGPGAAGSRGTYFFAANSAFIFSSSAFVIFGSRTSIQTAAAATMTARNTMFQRKSREAQKGAGFGCIHRAGGGLRSWSMYMILLRSPLAAGLRRHLDGRRELDPFQLVHLAEVEDVDDVPPGHVAQGVDEHGELGLAELLVVVRHLVDDLHQLDVALRARPDGGAVADLAHRLVVLPPHEDPDLLEDDLLGRGLLDAAVLREPGLDLAFELLELQGAHEEQAEAEDDVHERHRVDADGIVACLADVA